MLHQFAGTKQGPATNGDIITRDATFSLVGGVILAVIAPQFLEKQNEYALGMMLVFAWVFVEALLLSSFQTTPGKWLFKTKIALTSGSPINFSQALARSFKVWWRGFGTGFPIATMITMIIAHGRLTRNGITSWDKDDCQVPPVYKRA